MGLYCLCRGIHSQAVGYARTNSLEGMAALPNIEMLELPTVRTNSREGGWGMF
jgi:hypothetical protein